MIMLSYNMKFRITSLDMIEPPSSILFFPMYFLVSTQKKQSKLSNFEIEPILFKRESWQLVSKRVDMTFYTLMFCFRGLLYILGVTFNTPKKKVIRKFWKYKGRWVIYWWWSEYPKAFVNRFPTMPHTRGCYKRFAKPLMNTCERTLFGWNFIPSPKMQ